MSSSDEPKLPQDVIVEILKRLPVESLLRFRCVSRSWRSAIDDPRFVALHLNHSALDASNWYLLCVNLWDPVQRLCSLFSNESLTLPPKSQIEIPFVTLPYCYGGVDGSCNGLICITEIFRHGCPEIKTMYLWNLFTRKHKEVPRSGLEHRSLSVSVGFGFDARSNDYKIVRIFYVLKYNGGFLPKKKKKRTTPQPQVEIYSLSTDSWRSLECEVPTLRRGDRAVFLNGNLHWFAYKFDDLGNEVGYGSIVLFDVAGEVFDEMAPPEEMSHEDGLDNLIMSVAVLNDLLAVIISVSGTVDDPEPHFVCSVRVWVMREYGVPETWTKLYSSETSGEEALGEVLQIDGFTRNGKLVMEIDDKERVFWNPITGQYANIPISKQCDLVTVVESLVSL
ncbi:F-box protein At3g07870-like [Rhodamnia argentea]|uniref:F-box protein At3g07870-like n=1 Tax=Rhodamnia argentea TaxID=178133 RepID=A0ABM3GWJ3_9MYRT|nr:F-box protein At3g07870-like [Rhodamnia argentea]